MTLLVRTRQSRLENGQSPRRVLEAEADLGPVTTTITSRPVPSGHDPLGVESLLSRGRFASYLSATGGDCDQAVSLYRWNTALSADREVKPKVPSLCRRIDNVEWSEAGADRLTTSDEADEQRLGKIINVSRARGWLRGRYQVFFLTRPGEPGHLSLPGPIPNPGKGKGSAFTQRQRYISRDTLLRATSTEQL